jgi:hypothetical protein
VWFPMGAPTVVPHVGPPWDPSSGVSRGESTNDGHARGVPQRWSTTGFTKRGPSRVVPNGGRPSLPTKGFSKWGHKMVYHKRGPRSMIKHGVLDKGVSPRGVQQLVLA